MNEQVQALPIAPFLDTILADRAAVTLVRAETGAGKSIGVPYALLQAGQSCLIAEPLRETTIGTAEHLASLVPCPLGGRVGYAIGQDRRASAQTEALYCTTGLALVQGLLGGRPGGRRWDALILDETHCWSLDQEVLFAWALAQLQAGTAPFGRLILLSATVDAEEIRAHVEDSLGLSFSRHDVPGRTFPIEDRSAATAEDAIRRAVREGYDVLAFFASRKDITDCEMSLADLRAEVIPFHGGMDRSEKDRAYRTKGRGKVVLSTNALETGRTVLPTDGRRLAVVDTRTELRQEVDASGVAEALVRAPISKAQAMQRRGRTGRVSEGVYYAVGQTRGEYPEPEIQRSLLGQAVLRTLAAGFDLAALPLLHTPGQAALDGARRNLSALGFVDSTGALTPQGHEAARWPVAPWAARMLQEARARGCLAAAAAVVACIDVGGLLQRGASPAWELKSDVARDLALFESRGDEVNRGAQARARDAQRRILEAVGHQGASGVGGADVAAVEACYIIALQDTVLRPYAGRRVSHLTPDGTGLRPWGESAGARASSSHLVGIWRAGTHAHGGTIHGIVHAVPVTSDRLQALGLPVALSPASSYLREEGGQVCHAVFPALHGVAVGGSVYQPAPGSPEVATWIVERRTPEPPAGVRGYSAQRACRAWLESQLTTALLPRVLAGDVRYQLLPDEQALMDGAVDQARAWVASLPSEAGEVRYCPAPWGGDPWATVLSGDVVFSSDEAWARAAAEAELERLAARSAAERDADAIAALTAELQAWERTGDTPTRRAGMTPEEHAACVDSSGWRNYWIWEGSCTLPQLQAAAEVCRGLDARIAQRQAQASAEAVQAQAAMVEAFKQHVPQCVCGAPLALPEDLSSLAEEGQYIEHDGPCWAWGAFPAPPHGAPVEITVSRRRTVEGQWQWALWDGRPGADTTTPLLGWVAYTYSGATNHRLWIRPAPVEAWEQAQVRGAPFKRVIRTGVVARLRPVESYGQITLMVCFERAKGVSIPDCYPVDGMTPQPGETWTVELPSQASGFSGARLLYPGPSREVEAAPSATPTAPGVSGVSGVSGAATTQPTSSTPNASTASSASSASRKGLGAGEPGPKASATDLSKLQAFAQSRRV